VWPRKSSKKTDAAKEAPVSPATPKPAKAAKPRQPSPPADVYTFFLAIALIAVLAAILFLCLEMSPYDFKFKGGPPLVRMEVRGTQNARAMSLDPSSAVRFTHPTMT
jgi:hypothetical protein